jgi:hypothetical protein
MILMAGHININSHRCIVGTKAEERRKNNINMGVRRGMAWHGMAKKISSQ